MGVSAFKILGNCNSNKDDEFTIHQISTPYKTEDLLKFWSHDIERSPLDIKNDPSSSYNPSQPFNGIDSLALINPSFLVKPHSFSTESSPSSSTVQSTVKKEGTYVDSLQQEENLYELPQERESSTIFSTQSSFKTYDYNENEDLGYGIIPDERSTSIKPSPSSFKDQNYPEYNPENINAIILEDKISTTNPSEANNSMPEGHTTSRSKTPSSSKDDKEINYQESEGQPEEQNLQTSYNNAIESAADSTIGLARSTSTTKYPPPSSLDYGYDPVPAALTCPQAHICNQLSIILKKVRNMKPFLLNYILFFSAIILLIQWHTLMNVRVIFACMVKTLRKLCATFYKTMQGTVERWIFVKIGGRIFPLNVQLQNVKLTLIMRSVAQDVRGLARRLSVKNQQNLAASVMREW